MIIAIDHGNKQIKTIHKAYTSGLSEKDSRPAIGQEILHFNGKYYSLSDNRIPYMENKTVNERFYILTLFAIAYEIEAAGCYQPGTIIHVQLPVGLPPAHYGAQYEAFEKYFMKGHTENFSFRGKPYSIYINEAIAYPQAYAAAMTVHSQIRSFKTMVIDIGGFTTDYMPFKSGGTAKSDCDSIENGVIHFYNKVISQVNSDWNRLLDESDVDTILMGEASPFEDNIKRAVMESAQLFINDLFGILRERMIDLRSWKTVFVGGGSILFKNQIIASGKVSDPIFIDDIAANARGYELLYRASKIRR